MNSVIALVISIGLLVVAGCASHQPLMKKFGLPQSTQASLQTVLDKKGPIELIRIKTGEEQVAKKGIIAEHHPRSKDFDKDKLWIPVYSYVVKHDSKEAVLIDSGLDQSFANNSYGNYKGLFRFFAPKARQQAGQNIGAQLKKLDIDPKSVYFTHFHVDHTAGLPDLPKDIVLYAGPGEEVLSVRGFFYVNHFKGFDGVTQIDFTNAIETDLGKAVDLYGDQSFWAIHTPGHTKGHVSYLLITKEGPALIAGDALLRHWNLEHDVPGGKFNSYNQQIAEETHKKLVTFIKNNPHVKVYFGHE